MSDYYKKSTPIRLGTWSEQARKTIIEAIMHTNAHNMVDPPVGCAVSRLVPEAAVAGEGGEVCYDTTFAIVKAWSPYSLALRALHEEDGCKVRQFLAKVLRVEASALRGQRIGLKFPYSLPPFRTTGAIRKAAREVGWTKEEAEKLEELGILVDLLERGTQKVEEDSRWSEELKQKMIGHPLENPIAASAITACRQEVDEVAKKFMDRVEEIRARARQEEEEALQEYKKQMIQLAAQIEELAHEE